MALALNKDEVMDYLTEVFPQVKDDFAIDHLEQMAVTMRLLTADRHLRPGGTVSGPSMFGLADVAVYVMVLGMIGRKALTVTTNCSIDFMRKPVAGADLIAEGRLLKLGKLLAVGDILMRSEGSDNIVARATLTYAIPPKG
ncbi:PaaI family thioesterase [Arenibacterium sp. CAU 1754]